jgi:hypothetical protein
MTRELMRREARLDWTVGLCRPPCADYTLQSTSLCHSLGHGARSKTPLNTQ